jgi:hypothetical protein
MSKENVVYIHNKILLRLKKEVYSPICNNIDKLIGHYVKWNNSVTGCLIQSNS